METKEEGTVTISIERFNQLIKKEQAVNEGLIYTESIFYDCLVRNDYVIITPDDLNKKLIDANSLLEKKGNDIRNKTFDLYSEVELMSFISFVFNKKQILQEIKNLIF